LGGTALKVSQARLTEVAADTGFRPDTLEKVIRLLDLLNQITENPYLTSRLALKGGTALNLFVFDIPRLSVDIDLNYIGAIELAEMEAERPKLEAEILGICQHAGFTPNEIPSEDHAGGKWRLSYQNALGGTASLELDLNFMYRVNFHPIIRLDSKRLGAYQALQIPILDTKELAGGKLSALLTRNASRDLFDTTQLLKLVDPADEQLRLAYVLYGAMNPRADWRQLTPDNLSANVKELKQKLIPVLRIKNLPAKKDDEAFVTDLVAECKRLISPLFPLRQNEVEFISLLRDQGEIKPSLLTNNPNMIESIQRHPSLLRRAQSARRNRKS
jgi:predicted nucleotidyltransferase component of viral defense system